MLREVEKHWIKRNNNEIRLEGYMLENSGLLLYKSKMYVPENKELRVDIERSP